MPPTLEELLTRTPLGNADPFYNGYSVSGLPVCGADDSPRDERRRLLVSPQNPSVYFPLSRDVSANTNFLNINDELYRRILTATGGFVYNRTATGPNGRSIPLGLGALHLCRSESANAGRYEVFIADNSIINNAPANAAPLRRVNFDFNFDEIRAIVRSGILSSDHYRVDPTDHRHIDLMPDETEIRRIIELVEGSNSPIAAARRAPMVAALRQFQQDRGQQSLDMQREMRSEMRWQMIGMGVLTLFGGIYTGMLVSGKAGPIHRAMGLPFRGLYNFLRLPFDHGEGWRHFWNDATVGLRYRGIPTLLSIGTNLTEQARLGEFRPVADPTTPAVAERIENTINSRHNTSSILVEGPPGWGKEQLMRTLALRNPNTVYIQVTPNGMMGGTMYRGQLEQRLTDIPREIMRARKEGRQVVLCIDEFHEALSAGKSQESSVSLLEHWKGELARGDIRIVGFSTPRELLKARFIAGFYNDPAERARLSQEFQDEIARFERDGVRQNIELRPLLNRFQPVVLPPRPASDIVTILRDQIAARREGNGLTITMDDAALRRIAEMSASPIASEGHIPRTALAIFNGAIDANMTHDAPNVTITLDMINDYVRGNRPDIAQRFPSTPNAAAAPANPPAPNNAAAAPNPLAEVLMNDVNTANFATAMEGVDPNLARFLRERIFLTNTSMNVGQVLQGLMALDPQALTQASQSLRTQGLLPHEHPERLIYEATVRAAGSQGINIADPAGLPDRVSDFITRARPSIERRNGAEANDPARRDAEERARREAEARRGRP